MGILRDVSTDGGCDLDVNENSPLISSDMQIVRFANGMMLVYDDSNRD